MLVSPSCAIRIFLALFLIIVFVQQSCNFRKRCHCKVQVCRTFFRVLCLRTINFIPEFLRFQPFSEVYSLFISIFVIGILFCRFITAHSQMSHQIVAVFFHHRPAVFQQFQIVIPFIIAIRNQIDCIRPAYGCARGFIHHFHTLIRNDRRKQTVIILAVLHIPQPFTEKCRRIHQIRTRMEKNLCIAGPSKAFSGRAVRRQVKKIAFHAPSCILHQPVDPLIRAGKTACLFHIRIDCNGGKILRFYLRIPFYLHIAKSKYCKSGLIVILFTACIEQDFLLRRAYSITF